MDAIRSTARWSIAAALLGVLYLLGRPCACEPTSIDPPDLAAVEVTAPVSVTQHERIRSSGRTHEYDEAADALERAREARRKQQQLGYVCRLPIRHRELSRPIDAR